MTSLLSNTDIETRQALPGPQETAIVGSRSLQLYLPWTTNDSILGPHPAAATSSVAQRGWPAPPRSPRRFRASWPALPRRAGWGLAARRPPVVPAAARE